MFNFVPVNLDCLSTNSSTLSCTWEPPVVSDYTLLEYRLSYGLTDGFDYYPEYKEVVEIILSANLQQYAITSLQPFGGYLVVLGAVVSQGSTDSGSGSSTGSGSGQQAPMIIQTSTVNTTLPDGESIRTIMICLMHFKFFSSS